MNKDSIISPRDLKDKFVREIEGLNSDIGNIYRHLFLMQDDNAFHLDFKYTYENFVGKGHLGEPGKESWFWCWHKALRQTDYFNDCFKRTEKELLNKEDEKERRTLRHNLGETFEKRDDEGNFTKEYKRLLHLTDFDKRKYHEESIGGHLDMLMWNTVHIDKKDVLYNKMKDFFEFNKALFEGLLSDK